jgi:hypothetical protein
MKWEVGRDRINLLDIKKGPNWTKLRIWDGKQWDGADWLYFCNVFVQRKWINYVPLTTVTSPLLSLLKVPNRIKHGWGCRGQI